VEICTRIYRPRKPKESPLFRLVSQHIEAFLRVYPERFAKEHGPLRPVVERVLRGFIECGDVARGFARAWCSTCRTSYLIPYSCRGRSLCPSCEKKRSILWAEWLREEVLAPVPHRHVVFTMPRLLRGIFRKRRELLRDLSQCGAEALSEYMQSEVGADTRPGIVVAIATAGDMLQWNVHLHVLASDGAFSGDGTFHLLATWNAEALMRLFRERVLARLVDRHALSQELAKRLLTWTHPGFSAHVGEPIAADDTQALETVAGYVVRNPLSLQRLVYLDGQQAVIYKGKKHNPTLGRNFESMDPREWLARMADHIPDPGRHRTLFYAYYANRVRGDRAALEPGEPTVEEAPAKKRRCSASWARLISKVFHVDPLTCAKCGGKLEIIAYLHDQVSISKILDHLGLRPPETAKPPPPVHEILRVPVDEEGREIQAP
jgi:hypothetical protein